MLRRSDLVSPVAVLAIAVMAIGATLLAAFRHSDAACLSGVVLLVVGSIMLAIRLDHRERPARRDA
jgi:membrane-bound ClpP family serine protease